MNQMMNQHAMCRSCPAGPIRSCIVAFSVLIWDDITHTIFWIWLKISRPLANLGCLLTLKRSWSWGWPQGSKVFAKIFQSKPKKIREWSHSSTFRSGIYCISLHKAQEIPEWHSLNEKHSCTIWRKSIPWFMDCTRWDYKIWRHIDNHLDSTDQTTNSLKRVLISRHKLWQLTYHIFYWLFLIFKQSICQFNSSLFARRRTLKHWDSRHSILPKATTNSDPFPFVAVRGWKSEM